MEGSRAVARRADDLVRRCYSGLRGPAFQVEVVRAIHALLPVGAVFLATADPARCYLPASLLRSRWSVWLISSSTMSSARTTSTSSTRWPPGPAMWRRWTRLLTVGALAAPDIATSWRHSAWVMSSGPPRLPRPGVGVYLCLHRAESPYGFTPAEVRMVDRLVASFGNGCRLSLAAPGTEGIAAIAPGVVVLHPDHTLAAITGEAERLLAHVADYSSRAGRLPAAVYAAAACLQSIDRGRALPTASPTVRVRNMSGDWLLVHATHLHGTVDDIAVIIKAAHPSRNAPLVLSSLGLTPREAEVALLVLRGASTKTIGAELHLSAYTVKDHLKSIFDKAGVRSRRDLVAQVLTGRGPR